MRFAHFQSGQARVDHVLGEFYWTVARGDLAETDDYVEPPRMLSREQTKDEGGGGGELTWSLGTYEPAADLWRAFGLPGEPPEPEGVAPHQPSPYAQSLRAVGGRAVLAVAAILAVFVALWIAGARTVHRQTVSIPRAAAPGSAEAATFAGPIFVTSDGNLQVKVQAPVSNSWLYLDGALINEETGAVDAFDLEVSYYYGRDSDGSWSEGDTTATRYIPAVPPGRYTLRLEPQWEGGHAPPGCAPPQRFPPRRTGYATDGQTSAWTRTDERSRRSKHRPWPTTTPWPGAPPEPARCANEQAPPAQPAAHPSSPKPQPQPPSCPYRNRSVFKRHTTRGLVLRVARRLLSR